MKLTWYVHTTSLKSSHGFQGPPFTLHLYVTGTSALNLSLALQLVKTCADAVTCGGGGGGGDVVVGGRMVKRGSLNVLLVCRLLINRAVSCILCLPASTSLNVCPETPIKQNLLTWLPFNLL